MSASLFNYCGFIHVLLSDWVNLHLAFLFQNISSPHRPLFYADFHQALLKFQWIFFLGFGISIQINLGEN